MSDTAAPRRPSRRGRFVRGALITVGVLAVALGILLWILTRSWYITSRIEPVLTELLGGPVEIAQARFDGDGEFRLRGVTLRTNDDTMGEASRLCRIGSAIIVVDMERLVRGEVKVVDVELDDVELRISESLDAPGTFNFSALRSKSVESVDELVPPQVRVSRATIECGVHGNGRFEDYGRRTFSGTLRPRADEVQILDVGLSEVASDGTVLTDGINLTGEWNVLAGTHHVELQALALDERLFSMCPEVVRIWWRKLALEGHVQRMVFAYDAPERYTVDLHVRDAGITLPIWSHEFWMRYRGGDVAPSNQRPRMRVSEGRIRIAPTEIDLSHLAGELVSTELEDAAATVPYEVSLTIHDLPAISWESRREWLEAGLAVAPFEMSFAVRDFDVRRTTDGRVPSIELPALATRILGRFRLDEWTLSTSVELTRGAPVNGRAAEVRSSGVAMVTDGRGAYLKFPYEMEDIEAEIAFDSDRIELRSLTGRGSGAARVALQGVIEPASSRGAITMTLDATNVPIDERLRAALNEKQGAIFDALLDADAERGLRAAGLLDDAVQLGGEVNLDLDIVRAEGPDRSTDVTGLIDVRDAHLLFDRFPYPMQVTGGRLRWTIDGIEIEENAKTPGLQVRTAGGGRGTLTGDLRFQDGGRAVHPDLELTIADDRITPAMFAALPPSDAERDDPDFVAAWPGGVRSDAAERLQQLRLGGVLAYVVHIGARADGSLTYDIDVEIDDATMQPGAVIAETLGDGALIGPDPWAVTEGRGALRIAPDMVELTSFTGRQRNGAITMEGEISLAGARAARPIEVRMSGLDIGPHLLDLLPADRRDDGRELWARYGPSGRFDAALDLFLGRERDVPLIVELTPTEISGAIQGTPVTLRWLGGSIGVGSDQTLFRDAQVEVIDGTLEPGVFRLDGALGTAIEDPQLRGDWSDGTFASPIVIDLLHWFAAPRLAERVIEVQPAGSFDAHFMYRPAGDARAERDFSLTLEPRDARFVLRDTPIAVTMAPGAAVTFTPGRIELEHVNGRSAAQSFAIDGTVRVDERLEVDVALELEGQLGSADVAAFLPEEVRTVLRTLDLQENGASRFDDARLQLSGVLPTDDTPRTPFDVRVAGRLTLDDASFGSVIRFESITGPLDLSIVHVGGSVPLVEIVATPSRMTVLGQALTNIEAIVSLNEDGTAVQLVDCSAAARHGLVSATAMIGIGERLDYDVSLRLIRVPLEDFRLASAQATADENDAPPAPSPSPVRGDLYADLTFGGRRETPGSLVGRGFARIAEGRLGALPILVQLVQLLQFSAPASQLDYGEFDFFVADDTVHFERVRLESTFGASVAHAIEGQGTMSLDDYALNGRVRTRSGIAVLRDVVGSIGDHLAAIEITGTLWEPDVALRPLPGLGRNRWPLVAAPPHRKELPRDDERTDPDASR